MLSNLFGPAYDDVVILEDSGCLVGDFAGLFEGSAVRPKNKMIVFRSLNSIHLQEAIIVPATCRTGQIWVRLVKLLALGPRSCLA